ncbi:MAG: hypothetical protein ACM3SY_01025 [Candidatus Omnitrophota bacterium]
MKRIHSIFISVFIITLSFASFSCKDIVFDNPLDPNASKDVVKVIRVIDTALTGAGDITFDGEKFWKINALGDVSAFDMESGITIRSFQIVPGTGIAFLHNVLYLCSGQRENTLYVVDPLSGDIVNRISTRDMYPGYIAAFNNELIVFDVRSSGIFRYDPETGTAVRLFEMAGLTVGGMAVYKNGLLISDGNTHSIYHFSMTGDVIHVFSSPATGIGGIAVDNSDYVYLFMMDGKVYKVSLP